MMTRKNTIRGWKFLIFVVLLLLGLTVLGRGAKMPKAFEQAQSLEQAAARSLDSGMPVLVFATADWCDRCAEMKRGALKDDGVAKWITENTIPVVVDLSDRANPPAEAELLKLHSVPALVMMRGGIIIARLEGKKKSAEVLDWLADFSGPIEDWKHANPGKELPDISNQPKRLAEPRNAIKVNRGPETVTPGR